MKILYYNWCQFDKQGIGGGVNVYQRNLIDYLVSYQDIELYFLSSGFSYNPLKKGAYIQKSDNIYKEKCQTFEIINSPIMSPAYTIFHNLSCFLNDKKCIEIFDKFIQTYGPFDVIHFNNIEGISINTLTLKEKYPHTKFIVSIHNYQPICPLVQYFQNHNNCICHDFKNGEECLKCSAPFPLPREYAIRYRHFLYDILEKNHLRPLKPIIRLCTKFLKKYSKRHMINFQNIKPEVYAEYRKYNIEMLNKYADLILAVSDRVKEIMIQHGCAPEKIKTAYIGTKFADKQLKHSVASLNQPFTIAYLGYERIDKGFFFMIDALSEMDEKIAKNINIVLAVRNIHQENIFPKLNKFNNVKVYNGYSHNQLNEILSTVNLGMVPVLWEDNLPQVAIEMVACGVPILCSSFGGASELSQSKLFKFEGGNKKDFIEKLTYLVNHPSKLEDYWKYHSGLQTMEKHVKDLLHLYY